MRQDAIALERAQGAAKLAEERRLRREFTTLQHDASSAEDEEESNDSAGSSSSSGGGGGGGGEEERKKKTRKKKKTNASALKDPPNEYDSLFGSTLRAALENDLIDPAHISVDDSVRRFVCDLSARTPIVYNYLAPTSKARGSD